MSNKRAVSCFCWGAEIPNEVFAFFELLLFQTQHGTDAFQRKRQSQGRRPDHRAVPGGRGEILSGWVSKIAGQTHTLKLCVERPFGHGGVGQRRADIGRKRFSGSQIHDLHRCTVRRIAEKQDLKVRGFGITIHAALGDALLVVFQVTGILFLLTLFTLVVIADALHQPNEEADAEAGPDAKEGGYQDVLNQFHCVALLSQDRKSSSRSVAKSSAAEDLPPRGSPSRTFWMLPRPQAMPRLPLELKA